MTISSSDVFPALSPIPLMVTSACLAPAFIAARVFAVASPRSLWQCTLRIALSILGVLFITYCTSFSNSPGYIPVSTDIDTTLIYPTSRLVSMITGIMVQPNKAIVGANAFAHEAGIHQDGVLKNPMTYEIMQPETVGISSNKLVMGKHSGRHALQSRLKELGFNLSDEELQLVFTKFKELADKKKHVLDEDLEAITTEGVLRTTDVFSLEYIHVSSGTSVRPIASVTIRINERPHEGSAFGNGPIDAAFNAIAKLTGTESELLRFSVSAISGGTDAQGEVTVRLREDGLISLGRGTDADIITASARAYINGLNRLEFLKAHPYTASEVL